MYDNVYYAATARLVPMSTLGEPEDYSSTAVLTLLTGSWGRCKKARSHRVGRYISAKPWASIPILSFIADLLPSLPHTKSGSGITPRYLAEQSLLLSSFRDDFGTRALSTPSRSSRSKESAGTHDYHHLSVQLQPDLPRIANDLLYFKIRLRASRARNLSRYTHSKRSRAAYRTAQRGR